jgi:hypothetical protein
MKSTYNLSDHHALEHYIETMQLKPAASIQQVCVAILERAQGNECTHCRIEVNPDLLAVSYLEVPAMFARSMRTQTNYPSLQSFMSEGNMVLIAADAKQPTTFNRRALNSILKHRIFKCHKSEVPKSYRRRPGLLSRFMSEQTSYRIENESREDEIVWKIVESDV